MFMSLSFMSDIPLSVGTQWDIYTLAKSFKTVTICVTDGAAFAIGELQSVTVSEVFLLHWIDSLDSKFTLAITALIQQFFCSLK